MHLIVLVVEYSLLPFLAFSSYDNFYAFLRTWHNVQDQLSYVYNSCVFFRCIFLDYVSDIQILISIHF